MSVVLDASALVLALTTRSPAARSLRARVRSEICHSPQLLDAEVGQALRGMERGGRISSSVAELSLATIDSVVDQRHPHGYALRLAAWRLRENLTFYDALYVALAAALGVPLLTADRRLASAPRLPCMVELVV